MEDSTLQTPLTTEILTNSLNALHDCLSATFSSALNKAVSELRTDITGLGERTAEREDRLERSTNHQGTLEDDILHLWQEILVQVILN
ncbi:hypothetical protein GDO86_020014 [Hymenochirus boettgeri]|uniref:Uncharacterized protein n=1 Tax=Hymenochirus boettgeri TaxID=247094 RepID=A0A8T2II14_9PIPI|nr:hypothetical protein GDO86_020014 [Hymenochirus boettgeri]